MTQYFFLHLCMAQRDSANGAELVANSGTCFKRRECNPKGRDVTQNERHVVGAHFKLLPMCVFILSSQVGRRCEEGTAGFFLNCSLFQ